MILPAEAFGTLRDLAEVAAGPVITEPGVYDLPDAEATGDAVTAAAEAVDAFACALDDRMPMPTGILLGHWPSQSEGWHAARSSGIGGSEAAAILGLSPWLSPFALWHAKSGGWVDSESTPEQAWGTAIEPALLAWWRTAHEPEGWSTYGVPGATYVHRDRTWQHANPDGIAQHRDGRLCVVEAKKASSDDDWGQPGTDEVPPYYRVQVVHYMDVLGVDLASIVVTNFGRAPEFYWIERSEAEAELIREACADFWQSLLDGTPPPLDGHAATYRTVRRLHPDIDGTDVEVPADIADGWRLAKAQKKAVEMTANLMTSRLLQAMGTARRALVDGAPVARRQPSRGGVALYEIGGSK